MIHYEVSNTRAAFAIGMVWVGIAIASPLLGYLSDWMERRKTLLWITSFIGLVVTIAVLYVRKLPFLWCFPVYLLSASHLLARFCALLLPKILINKQ